MAGCVPSISWAGQERYPRVSYWALPREQTEQTLCLAELGRTLLEPQRFEQGERSRWARCSLLKREGQAQRRAGPPGASMAFCAREKKALQAALYQESREWFGWRPLTILSTGPVQLHLLALPCFSSST